MGWLDEVEAALGAQPVRRLEGVAPKQRAAVLVPLFVQHHALWVLFIRRASGLAHHPGALAFPGGSAQVGDEDEVATALREAEEELGLDPQRVLLLGQLSDVPTSSGFVISPVVGAVPWPLPLRVEAGEVAEVVPMPLSALANPTAVERRQEGRRGSGTITVLHFGPRRIAGATAAILLELLDRLSAAGVPRGGEEPFA